MASENAKPRGYVHLDQIEASKKRDEQSHRVKSSIDCYPGFPAKCQAFSYYVVLLFSVGPMSKSVLCTTGDHT